MSSTESRTSSKDVTPTITTNSPSLSPVSAEALAADSSNKQDSFESYLFPALSLIVVFLAIVHTYRVMSRRRLRRLHAIGLDSIDMIDDVPDEAVTVKLVRPRLYDVCLDGKGVREIGRETDWKEIMPLSSHVLVDFGDVSPTAPTTHPGYQGPSRLSEDLRQRSRSIVDSVKNAVLHCLKLLSLYHRRTDHELQARHNQRTDASLADSSTPGVSLDPNISVKLVTEVVILMPSVSRMLEGKQEHLEDEQLHDFAIAIKDSEWKGRVDLKGDSESSVAVQ